MKYYIRRHNEKFYIAKVDSIGNQYDTMYSCNSLLRAKLIMRKLELQDRLGRTANCDDIYEELDSIELKLK